MRNLRYAFLPFFVFILIFSGFTKKSSAGENWDFSVAPYMWFSALNGDATVNGNTSHVEASFSDLLKSLEFAASLHLEAYHKPSRVGFLLDGMYIKLEDSATVNPFNGPIGVNAEFGTQFLILDEGIFYRLVDKENSKFTLDGLFFGRIWYMEQTIDFKGQGPVGLSTALSGDKTWFDFNLGLRSSIALNEKLRTILRTDVGGFGLGFSSDFTWSGLGGFGYAITDNIEALIGFRGLYMNYDDGSGADRFELDLWMYNPFVAFNFTF